MGMFALLALCANDHEGLVTAFPVRVTPLSTSTYQLFFDQNGDMIERTLHREFNQRTRTCKMHRYLADSHLSPTAKAPEPSNRRLLTSFHSGLR